MKSIALYNEIKAQVREAMEAEANRHAWHLIAKDKLAEAKMLTATAKKMKANQDIMIDFNFLLEYIKAEITAEQTPASDADTDLTDYRPGDFPASENNSDEEIKVSPVQRVEPNDPDVMEEVPHESENL